MKKNINLSLSEDNYNKLTKIKSKSNISITEILNILVSQLDTNSLFLENKKINIENSIIKFKITEEERLFLENESVKSGNISLSSEIKFRLLNTIYKNKFFTNYELKTLKLIKSEINKIGVNINQISRNLLIKNIFIEESLKKEIDELKIKLDKREQEFYKFLKYTDNRF